MEKAEPKIAYYCRMYALEQVGAAAHSAGPADVSPMPVHPVRSVAGTIVASVGAVFAQAQNAVTHKAAFSVASRSNPWSNFDRRGWR